MDRTYIDYAKFQQMTERGVVYVTKMKKNLQYTIEEDVMYQTPEGVMQVRVQRVTFRKELKGGSGIVHHARIVTYVDVQKRKLISLLPNDMTSDPLEIMDIYHKRWAIELLFKQIKQNFPLKYFYGESANAIKIQIWVTLIANLLLMIMRRRLIRSWSFSGLATMVRITLMYYVDFYSLFNHPEILLSAKLQNDTIFLSATPINRRCGFLFGKVSPSFRLSFIGCPLKRENGRCEMWTNVYF